MSEEQYYNEDFWFNKLDKHSIHQPIDGYGEDYYVYKLYESIVTKMKNIPEEGYIVVLGTNRCVSFDLLCKHYGYDRCIGYDIANPTGHPNVRVMDCSSLGEQHDLPIAFAHNDIGSFPLTPKLKLHAQRWAVKNLIPGGYILSRNNLNSAKFDLESMMQENNVFNVQLECLKDFVDLSPLDEQTIEGHMISKKIERIFY
tara:strand:- start:850 stop:1449 length:600 start_codon:yes stop_codon:yes gene_type:complete